MCLKTVLVAVIRRRFYFCTFVLVPTLRCVMLGIKLHYCEIMNVDLFKYRIELGGFMDLQFSGIGRLISQSLQHQTQLTLASLGWSPKSGECAKSCVGLFLPELVCCIVAASKWLRQEGYKVYETLAEGFHAKWRGLCGYNPAISISYSTESVLMYSMAALLQTTVGIPPVTIRSNNSE
jgi:hypothetical protein